MGNIRNDYDKRVTRSFIRFLRESCITKRYKTNYDKYSFSCNRYYNCSQFITSVESRFDKMKLITEAFDWGRTNERYKFWGKVSKMWSETMKHNIDNKQ